MTDLDDEFSYLSAIYDDIVNQLGDMPYAEKPSDAALLAYFVLQYLPLSNAAKANFLEYDAAPELLAALHRELERIRDQAPADDDHE